MFKTQGRPSLDHILPNSTYFETDSFMLHAGIKVRRVPDNHQYINTFQVTIESRQRSTEKTFNI